MSTETELSSKQDSVEFASQNPLPETKKSGLLRSSAVVGVMTMLSRVLGLVRDVVVASVFGAGGVADAFFVAFKIPNFFRRLFAEGAFSQAFVPVFTEYKTNRGFDELKHLINAVSGSLTLVLLVLTGVSMVAAPLLATIFAPGFYNDEAKLAATADMLRITFPYLVFISMTAMSGAILNSFNRFAVPAFTPVLLNICLICAAFFLTQYMHEPIFALAWGVFIAGLVQMLFQLPFLMKLHLLPRPVWGFNHPGVRKILTLMVPALFGVSVSQINLLLDTVLASFLENGSVSWLYYSDRLASLPMGVFGIAVATVILPSLSTKHAEKSTESFSKTLEWALRTVILISLPAMLALLLVAEPLMTTIFYHGAITENDIIQATKSMRAYALGLLAFMFVKILAPGYFARQDIKTPVKIGVIAMVVNMVLNLILIWPLAHVGLALATSLSAWLNAGLLFWGLVKLGLFDIRSGWLSYLVKVGVANLGLVGVIYFWMKPIAYWFELSVGARILEVTLMMGSGIIVYFILLVLLGFRLKDFRMSFK